MAKFLSKENSSCCRSTKLILFEELYSMRREGKRCKRGKGNTKSFTLKASWKLYE